MANFDLTSLSVQLGQSVGVDSRWPIDVFIDHLLASTVGRSLHGPSLLLAIIFVLFGLAVTIFFLASLRRAELLLKQIAALGIFGFIGVFGFTTYLVMNSANSYDIRVFVFALVLAILLGFFVQALLSVVGAVFFVMIFPPEWSRSFVVYIVVCIAVLSFGFSIGRGLQPKFEAYQDLRDPATSISRINEIFEQQNSNRPLMRAMAGRQNLPETVLQALRIKYPDFVTAAPRAETARALPAEPVAQQPAYTALAGAGVDTAAAANGKSLRFATAMHGFQPANDVGEVSQFEDKVIVFAEVVGYAPGPHQFQFEVYDTKDKKIFTSPARAFVTGGEAAHVYGWFRLGDGRDTLAGTYRIKGYIDGAGWKEEFLRVTNKVVTTGSGQYVVELKDVPYTEPVLSNVQISTLMDPVGKVPLNEWFNLSPHTTDFMVYTVWSRLNPGQSYQYQILLLDPQDRVINRGELKMKTASTRWGFWTRHKLPSQRKLGEYYKLSVSLDGRLWATRPFKIEAHAAPFMLPNYNDIGPRAPAATILSKAAAKLKSGGEKK